LRKKKRGGLRIENEEGSGEKETARKSRKGGSDLS